MTPEELDRLVQEIRENVQDRLRRVRAVMRWYRCPIIGKRPVMNDWED